MKKCKYCNKKISKDNFCSVECKQKAYKYFKYFNKYKYLFGFIVGSCLLAIIMQITFFVNVGMSSKIIIIILGITFFIFPFGNTINTMGIKKTVAIIRILSIILIIIGAISMIM